MNDTPKDNSGSKDEQIIAEIRDNILRKWEVLREENMPERSALSSIKADKKSKKIIERANKAIEQIKLSIPTLA